MRLYHHPFSSNARRAVMTAHYLEPLLASPVELHRVELSQGAHRTPAFLKLNPNGKVPVLVDDDFVLNESHAIMQYLADSAPGQTLWPTARRPRADVSRWLYWCAYHLTPAIGVLNFEHWVKRLIGQGGPDGARVAAGEVEVRRLLELLDAHLAGRTWASGDQLSLADLALATPMMHMESAHLPANNLSNLAVWLRRVQALPAWERTQPPPLLA